MTIFFNSVTDACMEFIYVVLSIVRKCNLNWLNFHPSSILINPLASHIPFDLAT